MLSLSPRYDLFKIAIPKTMIPDEVQEKYQKLINKNPGVITTAIDYLNESIKAVNIPGISDILINQTQHSTNSITRSDSGKLKKFNVEPSTDITYQTPANPLSKINREFKITFRLNQGLYNYFLMYETIFHQLCKPLNKGHEEVIILEILNEDGVIISRIKFFDVLIDGIEGLDFDYSKLDRDSGTFDVTFKFNNIDFDFV